MDGSQIKTLLHLEEFLEERQDEVYDLEKKIEDLEWKLDAHQWAWMRHMTFFDDGFRNGLPSPRLEMMLEPLDEDWVRVNYVYGIVYRFYAQDEGQRLFLPISSTINNGGGRDRKKELTSRFRLPYRDGVHIKSEMILFNLPGYLTIPCEEVLFEIQIEEKERDFIKSNISKGNS